MDDNWYVYVIQSVTKGVLYTGIAIDPDQRLRKHNGAVKGGAKATRTGRPWNVVFVEGSMTKSEALKREAEIKSLSRARKFDLIGRSSS